MTERERLIEIIDNYDFDATICNLCERPDEDCEKCGSEKLADYLLNNDILVQPRKCRSKVYTIVLNKVEEYEIDSYTVDADGFSFVHLAFEQNGTFYGRTLDLGDFNKKFYLTREEADKKLKEHK